jgi:hypothetical protein
VRVWLIEMAVHPHYRQVSIAPLFSTMAAHPLPNLVVCSDEESLAHIMKWLWTHQNQPRWLFAQPCKGETRLLVLRDCDCYTFLAAFVPATYNAELKWMVSVHIPVSRTLLLTKAAPEGVQPKIFVC